MALLIHEQLDLEHVEAPFLAKVGTSTKKNYETLGFALSCSITVITNVAFYHSKGYVFIIDVDCLSD